MLCELEGPMIGRILNLPSKIPVLWWNCLHNSLPPTRIFDQTHYMYIWNMYLYTYNFLKESWRDVFYCGCWVGSEFLIFWLWTLVFNLWAISPAWIIYCMYMRMGIYGSVYVCAEVRELLAKVSVFFSRYGLQECNSRWISPPETSYWPYLFIWVGFVIIMVSLSHG